MGRGRPVVATGRGGSGEYLRDEHNCLLFDADDPEALAAALGRLAGDDALRARVRHGGLETAPRYTDELFNEAVEEELARAAGARPRREKTS
jgi:glycosyltransferase involved in cell wall biosynthesis